MANRQADVCIIGGGLVGCFTALFLREADCSVILLEKGKVGREASGTNFGNLRLQGRKPEEFPLSLCAHRLWERFEDLTEETCGFDGTGHAYLAFGPQHHARLEQYTLEAKAAGVDVSLLDGVEIQQRWPKLSAMVTAATWSPRDGIADPERACPAVARAAARRGAVILEGTPAISIERSVDGFKVTTGDSGEIACRWVVNAAGAWSNTFAAALGEPVPMFSAGPPIIATAPVPALGIPSMLAVDGSIIFRQLATGEVVTSSFPRQPCDLDNGAVAITPERVIRDLGRLADVIPSLLHIEARRAWSGVEGYLPDMLPVIGPSGTTAGVVHAFGFSGHGYQLAPGVGRVVTDLIVRGRSDIPIAAFSIARFEKPVVDDERLAREFEPSVIAAVTASKGTTNA